MQPAASGYVVGQGYADQVSAVLSHYPAALKLPLFCVSKYQRRGVAAIRLTKKVH